MSTGAITLDYLAREPARPPMSEEEAVAAILEGHRAGAYALPAPLIAAAEGAAAVAARATAVHLELNAAAAALDAGPARLVAEIVRASATAGALPKIDAGAEMVGLGADLARLRHEDTVYQNAADKVASYPVTIFRGNAAAAASALDIALGELLADAAPHSARLAAVDPEAGDPLVKAYKADAKGYEALSLLVPRLTALDGARDALARLGSRWTALPADDGRAPVLRLAALAAEPSETS
jgi:hypothetical protein